MRTAGGNCTRAAKRPSPPTACTQILVCSADSLRLCTELPLSTQVAYGKDGEPTKALTGFAAKNGVALEDCTKEADAKGVEYVWAMTKQEGRHAAEVCLYELSSHTQTHARRGAFFQ